ncbi:uncharacterized protein LOC114269841 [Camellia sinensis]|uniref:uncharacterized protein LOC114269841 n=1 Tax=Camellia sinensis TaxID=4442 RepID=UPI0010359CE3|nr:uncharacterized protein LOC114269841 [Camellia sinensis]
MKLSKDQLDKIPIWVKLFNVPMEYWDEDGLSRIASVIGEPLYMDILTAYEDRVSFAKVCVEIGIDSILPTDFLIKCEGTSIEVRVEYLLKPTKCKVFGHADDRCIRTQVENIVQSSIEQQVQNSDEEWKTIVAKVTGILYEVEIAASIEVTDVARRHRDQDVCEVQEVAITGSLSEIVKAGSEEPESILDPSEPDPEIQANSLSLEEEVADRVMLTQRMLRSAAKPCAPKATGSSSSRRKKKRGLNDPSRQREVAKFLKKEDINIVGLLKTKVIDSNHVRILNQVLHDWVSLSNYEHAILGRIWVCWNPAFCTVDVLDSSDQHMWCKIKVLNGDIHFFAGFVYMYGSRRPLFNKLEVLAQLYRDFPCILLGDFNAIRFPYEKVEGDHSWSSCKNEFNLFINQSELDDLNYGGCQFTWANKQCEDRFISSKIDRALVNGLWLNNLPHSHAYFHPSGTSDHSPCIVTVPLKIHRVCTPFKFFNMWANHPDFIPVVRGVWCKYVKGSPLFRICSKLRSLKPELKALNKKHFSDVSVRTSCAKEDLDRVQLQLDKNMGDSNLNRSRISSVTLDDGSIIVDPHDVKSAFVSYFEGFLGKPFINRYSGGSKVEELIKRKLSPAQVEELTADDLECEIESVFRSLNSNKAPGPDGYPASFFKSSWDVVGKDVIQAIKSFFHSSELLKEVNSTAIALVPKVPNPSKVGDYRPISCCNTVYKCIAKILANRIKKVLPDVIDSVQSAFVQGRRISDNIFLSQELMRGYHRGSGSPRCAMKFNIMKAYDNVRWDFIFDTLAGMGFHSSMIGWIRACITSPSFSICINGELCGYFRGARGLRQGDPISPYLFVIVMEVLDRLLAEKAESPDFKFHWRCEKNKIINLCFADDFEIFCRGDISSVSLIKEALDEFQGLSGQSPSPPKSHMFFTGMDCHLKAKLLSIMDFKEGNLPVWHLGVPLISTKLRKIDCDQLVARITKRIQLWTNKVLSYAGRAQLIKFILFSMQVYWASLSILPKKVVKETESCLRASFWNGPDSKKNGAKVAWVHLCVPWNEGGLGFKSIERKLLDLRSIIAPLIKYNVGNGKATFLWFDNWLPLGPVFNRFGERVIFDSGIQKFAKVESVIYGTRWKWPVCRTWELNKIKVVVPADMKPSLVNDKVVWLPSSDGKFSIKSAWDK